MYPKGWGGNDQKNAHKKITKQKNPFFILKNIKIYSSPLGGGGVELSLHSLEDVRENKIFLMNLTFCF